MTGLFKNFVSRRELAAAAGASLIGFSHQNSSATNVQDELRNTQWLSKWGQLGNGHDTEIFQSALNDIKGKPTTLKVPNVTLNISGTLVVDLLTTIHWDNTTIISTNAGITLFRFDSQITNPQQSGFFQSGSFYGGLTVFGDATTTSWTVGGATCFDFSQVPTGGVMTSGYHIKDCSVIGFLTQIKAEVAHGFRESFSHCSFVSTYGKCLYTQAGGVENISFSQCMFFNFVNQTIIDVAGGSTSVYFNQCSFDYSKQYVRVAGGWVYYSQCYFENGGATTGDTSYLFGYDGTTDPSSVLSLTDCSIYFTSTGRTNFSLGYALNSGANGIQLNNVRIQLAANPYALPYLFENTGRVSINNVYSPPLDIAKGVATASSNNLMDNGDFHNALVGWTTYGDTAKISTPGTAGPSGNAALKFTGAIASSTGLLLTSPLSGALAGKTVHFQFYLKTTGLVGGDSMVIALTALGQSGASLAAPSTSTVTVNSNTSYIIAKLNWTNLPAGCTSVNLAINVAALNASGAIYLANIHTEIR